MEEVLTDKSNTHTDRPSEKRLKKKKSEGTKNSGIENVQGSSKRHRRHRSLSVPPKFGEDTAAAESSAVKPRLATLGKGFHRVEPSVVSNVRQTSRYNLRSSSGNVSERKKVDILKTSGSSASVKSSDLTTVSAFKGETSFLYTATPNFSTFSVTRTSTVAAGDVGTKSGFLPVHPENAAAGVSSETSTTETNMALTLLNRFWPPADKGSEGEEKIPDKQASDENSSDEDSRWLPLFRHIRTIESESESDDDERVIKAVELVVNASHGNLSGGSSSFEWSNDYTTFDVDPKQYTGPEPGPTGAPRSPYDAFTSIWDREIIGHIARETNRYARQRYAELEAQNTSVSEPWIDTTPDEIYVFLALSIIVAGRGLGVTTDECWTPSLLIPKPNFEEVMPFKRYVQLNAFLHFVDNTVEVPQDATPAERKLHKLRPILDHVNSRFKSIYNVGRDISLGEPMTISFDHLCRPHRVPSKTKRLGVQALEICDSQTGYLHSLALYAGRRAIGVPRSDEPEFEAPSVYLAAGATDVILALLSDYEGKGHHLTMNTFYNSPALMRHIKLLGFECLATLRPQRAHVPVDVRRFVKASKRLKSKEMIARHCGDLSIIAWKSERVISVISTYHGVGSRPKVVIQRCGRDLVRGMVGVGIKNKSLYNNLVERRKESRWYIRLFKRLVSISIHNAMIVYNEHQMKIDRPKTLKLWCFQMQLANQLLKKHGKAKVR